MCGIIGYLDKRPGREHAVGRVLLSMLGALSCRGPDSAGVAVFTSVADWQLHLALPEGLDRDKLLPLLHGLGVAPFRNYPGGVSLACLNSKSVNAEGGFPALERQILDVVPGAELLCLGQRLHLYKQVGSPQQLEAAFGISKLTGSHGIGHTRLSTESRVDLSHSQPFWAHGVPDLATVHNGHVTNYHKLRRQYEQRGYRFFTENDSEVIGVYLRDRMAKGMSLPDALRSSLDDFDGSFSYLAAWDDGLAYVKDRFGFKPLVVAETEHFVAIATEEIALRQALGRDFVAREPAPGTMQVWSVSAAAVARV